MGLSNHKLLKGTLLLSVTGFITRILGFLYKIYLADLLGAKLLGIYQLIFPVYAICFTIYGAGMQTAISQVIAASNSRQSGKVSPLRLFAAGTTLSLFLAFLLQGFVYTRADWIALRFVMEPSLTPYLKIMCTLFPFCCLSACINGYYYGIQDAHVPAVSQIIEQLFRVLFVFSISMFAAVNASPEQSCRIAVWGLVTGEIAACIYNAVKLAHHCHKRKGGEYHLPQKISKRHHTGLKNLLFLASTLTLTRLFITFLNSVESVLLPAMLRKYGCSAQDALSIYGVLTGMSLSFLFFPSTITNSLAVMLIPSVAQAHAKQDKAMIQKSISASIQYCLILGLLCTCLFLVFGRELGNVFFHNEDAGSYLVTLSWLCPFLYLGTTLTSIINGLEKTHITFLITVASLGIKIAFLLFAVPVYGIRAYLIGLLVSQFIQVFLEIAYLYPYLTYTKNINGVRETAFDPIHWIAIPSLFLVPCGIAVKSSYQWLGSCLNQQYAVLRLGIAGGILCLAYGCYLIATGSITLTASLRHSPFSPRRHQN